MLGIGVNVAVRGGGPARRSSPAGPAGSGLEPADVEPVLAALLAALERRFAQDPARDPRAPTASATRCSGARCAGSTATGVAAGVDDDGRLLVDRADGGRVALDAGEVQLAPASSTSP